MTQSNPTLDVIMSHRSVRAFTDQPLPSGLLETLVMAGTRASTSSNMQAYSVISVSEPTRKKKLAELCADQKQIHQSAAFLVFCADLHKLTHCCAMHDTDAAAAGQAEALLIAVIDAALVMQNVAIAAESHDLGICMIGAMRNDPFAVAELLNLPRHVMAIAGFCIGYPAEEGEVKPRLPLSATLHHERYRADDELERDIHTYDDQQSRWYAERDMHPRDPRWSSVMSRRLPKVTVRADVGRFLLEQGFFVDSLGGHAP